MKTFIKVLTTPSCWIQNASYSKVWDEKLIELLKIGTFEKLSECSAVIGGIEVWIANHPYASFTPTELDVRPSRRTILKAHEKLCGDVLKV